MIDSVNNYPVSTFFHNESKLEYIIPKYQREYTWGQSQWGELFNDLDENNEGYFLGTIIVINNTKDAFDRTRLEVVDGQQRLTTLSLLLMAIYEELLVCRARNEFGDNEEVLAAFLNLKKQLVIQVPNVIPRLSLQVQNNNRTDYLSLCSRTKLITEVHPIPKYAGNRKIHRAFNYFQRRIREWVEERSDLATVDALVALRNKINSAVLVQITVATHSDAYTLFESLNMRGMPLSAIDLIKNTLLATASRVSDEELDKSFIQWQQVLAWLGDDIGVQERFFRQYYNAFRDEINKRFPERKTGAAYTLGTIATRTNLLDIYERLIEADHTLFLDEMVSTAQIYSILLGTNDDPVAYHNELLRLSHIQGAPAYLLLMYLVKKQLDLALSDRDMCEIIDLLVRFFVRRNLTDKPNTRDLTRIFMNTVTEIHSNRPGDLYTYLHHILVQESSTDEEFAAVLNGPMYETNYGATRFILCHLCENQMTQETFSDLWTMDRKGRYYLWTVEHIFPQTRNIPDAWVEMIAAGEKQKALEHQEAYVHKLGNLTLSGYNNALGTKSFTEKRDRKSKDGRNFIGYKNGLALNADLANREQWQVSDIEERTQRLITLALQAFSLAE